MLRVLQTGWELLQHHKKAIVCFYLANLLTAGMLIFSFMAAFDESLGEGLYRDRLVSEFDYDWYRLFRDRVSGLASTFSPAVLGVGPFAEHLQTLLDGNWADFPSPILSAAVLYLLAGSFLLGATLGSFSLDPRGTSIREFLRTGGALFGRFLRLTILAIVVFWIVKGWILEPVFDLVDQLAVRASTDKAAFYWRFAPYPLSLLLLLALNVLFDYAKIKTAAEDRTSVILALFSSLAFCRKHAGAVSLIYLSILGLGLLWVAVYTSLDHLLPQGSAFVILVGFLWQQVFVVGRLVVKLFFYSCQMQFYLDMHRE